MAHSAFDDKARPPGAADLARTLGRARAAWDALREAIASDFPPVVEEWGFASKSTGWGLRLKREQRVVLYMTPREGCFLASFALGEKAVAAARASGLPAAVLDAIERAPRYAEGRGVRLEVRAKADVAAIRKLAGVKMAT